jgi:hypothetical protein
MQRRAPEAKPGGQGGTDMTAIYVTSLENIACAALLVAALALPSVVQAEPPARTGPADAVDTTTVYAFDDDEVLGATTGPVGEVLFARPRGQRESLIRAREHFVRELLHSIEAL